MGMGKIPLIVIAKVRCLAAIYFPSGKKRKSRYYKTESQTLKTPGVKAVPAGQRLSLHVEYTLTAVQLSAARLPAPDTGAQTSGVPPKSVAGMGISWPMVAIVAGGIIIVLAMAWLFVSRRPSSAPPGSEHTQDGKQSRAKFCSHCGGPVGKEYRYCSQCGNRL